MSHDSPAFSSKKGFSTPERPSNSNHIIRDPLLGEMRKIFGGGNSTKWRGKALAGIFIWLSVFAVCWIKVQVAAGSTLLNRPPQGDNSYLTYRGSGEKQW